MRLALFLKLKIKSYAYKHSTLKIARKFKLNYKTVKNLIKIKDKLLEASDNYPWKFQWKEKKLKFNHCIYPELENKLLNWVKNEFRDNEALDKSPLEAQELKFAQQSNLNHLRTSFGWTHNFLKRVGLVKRSIGVSVRVLPTDAQDQINKFMKKCHDIILEKNLDLNHILNMDIISVNLDSLRKFFNN